jgi:diguanylate cyclase (GGDEF)-like protein
LKQNYDIKSLSRRDLLTCLEIGKYLTSELETEHLYETMFHKLSTLIPAQNWSLLVSDRKTSELKFALTAGLDIKLVEHIRLQPGEGMAGQASLRQEIIVIPDVSKYPEFTDRIDKISGFKTRSAICVPLVFSGKSVGVIEAINPHRLKKRDITLMMIISDYIAISLINTRRYNKMNALANRDELTGLYNTRYLYKTLGALMEEAKAKKEPLSLIFLDIDNFKITVDTHGHLNGSRAIQEVGSTIREMICPPEFGVSYGGDEFVVVLPACAKGKAVRKAEMIQQKMRDMLYLSSQGLKVRLSASFGVSTYPDDCKDMKKLMGLADRAMFDVKARGKDGIGSIRK